MYPAPNHTDWQVATFQRQQAMAEGMRQQAAASVRPARTGGAPVWAGARQRCGAFLVRAGQRLQHAYASETPGIGSRTANERATA
jgi:hypothetical protein